MADGRTERRLDLVLKGGGVKGAAFPGAIAALEEADYQANYVAGASAGAIVGALHAAGYSAAELRTVMDNLNFLDFLDRDFKDRIPLIGRGLSLLFDQGIYEGEAFREWLEEKLVAKGVHTFGDLRQDEAGTSGFQHRLQVIASDISARRLLVLPRDADVLGIPPDELDVATAVRMSMSIPFFFEPYVHHNPTTDTNHVIVDGGMLSNFPVWLFDVEGTPRWPTFGLMLVDGDLRTPVIERTPTVVLGGHFLRRTVSFTQALVSTMIEAHDRLYLEDADFVRTIPIPNLGVGTTEFALTHERKGALYDSGYESGTRFLRSWDMDRYVAEHRSGVPEESRQVRLRG